MFNHPGSTILLLFFITLMGQAISQDKLPEGFCITIHEQLLADRINLLRQDYGKPAVELSASLSYVASVHVDDLMKNRPDTSVCNLSSWSDQGDWTPCCYNSYVPRQDCMWDKPKELTPYPYRGYELVAFFEDGLHVDSVLRLWSSTKEVLDMLLTEGNYTSKKWICMGVAINEHYVSVWFGQRSDRLGEPEICSNGDSSAVALAGSPADADFTYYLIFGSYSEIKDAREAVKRYTKNGFPEAGTLKSNGNIRVYLNKFTNLKEAMYAKQNLPYSYREAWIYKE